MAGIVAGRVGWYCWAGGMVLKLSGTGDAFLNQYRVSDR